MLLLGNGTMAGFTVSLPQSSKCAFKVFVRITVKFGMTLSETIPTWVVYYI